MGGVSNALLPPPPTCPKGGVGQHGCLIYTGRSKTPVGCLRSPARDVLHNGSVGRAELERADADGTGGGSGMKWDSSQGLSFWGCFWAVWGFLCVSPLVLPFSAPTESSIEEIFESQNSRIPGAIAVCKASVLLSFIHGFTVFRTVFFLLEPAEPVLTDD